MELDRNLEKEIQDFGSDVIEDTLQRTKMMGKTISGISGASRTNSFLASTIEALEAKMKKMNPGSISFEGAKRHCQVSKPGYQVFS